MKIEEEVEIVIAPSRRKANYERCQKICEMYLQLSKLPQFIHSKAKRLQIACCIRTVRNLYLFS